MQLITPAPTPSLSIEFDFNPVAPLPGKGPSEMQVRLGATGLEDARLSNTQNPNYLRAGTEWRSNAQFEAAAGAHAQRLREAVAALATVPSDAPEPGYTRNGRFELRVGEGVWNGSLMFDKRAAVRAAVKALLELGADMRQQLRGTPNSV